MVLGCHGKEGIRILVCMGTPRRKCGKVLGTKGDPNDLSETSGLCPECKNRYKEDDEYESRAKRIRIKNANR